MTGLIGVLSVASVVLILGCDDATGPEEVLEVGVIAFFGESDPYMSVPDTVDAGVPFNLVTRTYGDECIRVGPTEVTQGAAAAVVVPYDYRDVSGAPCQESLRQFDHEVVLVFSAPGPATVTIQGRVSPGDTAQVFAREVWVR